MKISRNQWMVLEDPYPVPVQLSDAVGSWPELSVGPVVFAWCFRECAIFLWPAGDVSVSRVQPDGSWPRPHWTIARFRIGAWLLRSFTADSWTRTGIALALGFWAKSIVTPRHAQKIYTECHL